MLRLIFVFLILLVGAFYAAQGPFYALLLYLWNASFRPDEWTFGGLIGSLQISLIIGAYLVLRTALSMPSLKLNARTGLLLAFLAQAVVSTIASEHPEFSSSFLVDFLKVLVISYLIVVLVDDPKKFRMTLIVIAISLAFECAKQGWLGLIRAPGARNENPIAFLGDNNGVALGTMMLVPILNALAQTTSSRWEKYGYRFLAVGVFLRGFSTYSRGGFLAAGVIGVFTLLRAERKMRALVGVAAVACLIWTVMPETFWDRMQTISAPDAERDNSTMGRLHFWDIAVSMANAKPLTGVGLNGFNLSYARYNVTGEFDGDRAAHSAWFGALADLGYPGLFLLVANLVMAVWSCWQVHRWTRRDPAKRDLRVYANALITSLVAYAVAASFLSQHYSEMLWHFIGLSTALYLIARAEVRATS